MIDYLANNDINKIKNRLLESKEKKDIDKRKFEELKNELREFIKDSYNSILNRDISNEELESNLKIYIYIYYLN